MKRIRKCVAFFKAVWFVLSNLKDVMECLAVVVADIRDLREKCRTLSKDVGVLLDRNDYQQTLDI